MPVYDQEADMPYIETFKGKGKQPWYFHLVGGNGEIILPSEGYSRKWNRDRAIRHLQGMFKTPLRVEPKQ